MKKVENKNREISIDKIKFSSTPTINKRIKKILCDARLITLGDVVDAGRENIRKMVGVNSFTLVEKSLIAYGLEFPAKEYNTIKIDEVTFSAIPYIQNKIIGLLKKGKFYSLADLAKLNSTQLHMIECKGKGLHQAVVDTLSFYHITPKGLKAKSNSFSKENLEKNLATKGLDALKLYDCKLFTPNSHSMDIITKCVNKFIKDMVKVKDEKNVSVEEANKISALVDKFNKIVAAKRKELKEQAKKTTKPETEKED